MFPSDDQELSWSSWAAVEFSDDGRVTAVLRGTTLPWMPQSSQSAEFCAGAAAEQIAGIHGITLYGDCANVVAVASMHTHASSRVTSECMRARTELPPGRVGPTG